MDHPKWRSSVAVALFLSAGFIGLTSCNDLSRILNGEDGTGGSDALAFVTTELPDGVRDHAYSATITVTGGTPPHTLWVSDGELPPGLTLSGDSVTGTPSADGPFMFTVTAQDASTPPQSKLRVFTLRIELPPGSGTAYYVDPLGDDSAPGTLDEPWKTLRHAIPQLGPGDTLYLRAGRYFERDIRVSVAGTAINPITIRNFSGEDPIVDGGFQEFRTPGNQDWELVDGRGIYRSVRSFSSGGYTYGYFGPDDGGFRLVTYEDFGPLSTDNEDYYDQWPYYYIGPGVFWDSSDDRIYIRLKHSKYEAPMGFNVPASTDPRQTPLYLFPVGEGLNFTSSAAHIVLDGIRFRYLDTGLHFEEGAHDVIVRRCEVLGGRYHILAREGSHDLIFDQLTVPDRVPPWIARSDVKRPSSGRPGHRFQGAAIALDGRVVNVEIMGSTFLGLFDAIDGGSPENVHIHHNLFDTIRDDVFEIGSAGFEVEFDHNVILNAAAAVSWAGTGAPPPGKVGTKYIHHNVFDTSVPQLYGRSDPLDLMEAKYRGPNGDGMASGRTFGMHTRGSISGPDPWKIYHNTIMVTQDVDGKGTGHCYYIGPNDPSFPHEVFNNIFIQVHDHWVARAARVADGSQIHDGNLYFRSATNPTTPLLRYENGSQDQDFDSLAEFKSSSYWSATRAYYPPGWEASGVEADPRLDAQHRPDPDGPAAAGAVDLNGRGWPGLAGEGFRGALAPHPR